MAQQVTVASTYSSYAIPKTERLNFRPITIKDLPEISRVLKLSNSLTCDYSIGGIFMWRYFFNYRFCIVDDTLFISGVEENHTDTPAFSCPVGKMPLVKAIDMVRDYCEEHQIPLQFSAVPADRLICFTTVNPQGRIEELSDWADYLYDIESFATLSGKKMAKKRNHFNRFMTEHPEAVLERITETEVPSLRECLREWCKSDNDTEDGYQTCVEEQREVLEVLDNYNAFPFEGYFLKESPNGEIVAFTIGEKINDMLFVHIEKMDHNVAGAGETIAHLYAREMHSRYSDLKFLNREEDCGDPGLRYAKESWHPTMKLSKYNVLI